MKYSRSTFSIGFVFRKDRSGSLLPREGRQSREMDDGCYRLQYRAVYDSATTLLRPDYR